MEERWPDYACFPANGADFERYVGTLLEDCGYKVELTPPNNDYGVDLLLEKGPNVRIAVQVKFYNHSSLGNSPIQEVTAGLKHWNAREGWVITNGRFSQNAKELAKSNAIRLIDNEELNALIANVRDGHLSHTDFSGLDKFIMPHSDSLCNKESPSTSNNPRRNRRKLHTESADNADRLNSEQVSSTTYNKSDVKIRWGCSTGFVEKQIALGMPMKKLPNGRWSIKESDLLLWESHMNDLHQKEERSQQIIGLIIAIAIIASLLIVYFLFDLPLPFDFFSG